MASPRHPQKVVIVGHSFVKGIIQAERTRIILPNGAFTRRLHINRYLICLPPDVQVYLVKDLLGNISALSREIGTADLVVFVMGSNDLVSDPHGLDKNLEDLLKVGIMLVANRTTKYVAFVEVFSRLGPGGFKRAAQEFQVIRGVRTPRDVDNYFWLLAMMWNSKLSARIQGHPDFL